MRRTTYLLIEAAWHRARLDWGSDLHDKFLRVVGVAKRSDDRWDWDMRGWPRVGGPSGGNRGERPT